jgi:copper chaperone
MTSKTLKVEGMSCHHCTEAVSRAVRALNGVQDVQVSLGNKSAEVRYDESRVSVEELAKAIEEEGYSVVR